MSRVYIWLSLLLWTCYVLAHPIGGTAEQNPIDIPTLPTSRSSSNAIPSIANTLDTNETPQVPIVPSSQPPQEPTEQPAIKKPKSSNRCALEDCNAKKAKIVGDCRYCCKEYCMKHRHPETHCCEKLEDQRNEQRERLRERLEKEKTVKKKIDQI